MHSNSFAKCLLLLSVISLFATPALGATHRGCLATHYKVIELPLLPLHLNNLGDVVGTTTGDKAATWSLRGGLHEVPVPEGFSSVKVNALDNVGDVAVEAIQGDLHRALTLRRGKYSLVAGNQAKVFSLNDHGEAVGEGVVSPVLSSRAMIWKHHQPVALGGCCGGTATDINNRGEVVGNSYDEQARYHAFLWTRSRGLRIIDQSSTFSTAVAINNLGHVLIQATPGSAFLYVDGILTPLKLSPSQPPSPKAINDCDVIVGAYGAFSDVERAFVWDRTRGFTDLNDLLPADSGWKLESAVSINDRGEIAGVGDHGSEDVGFLLIPQSN